MCQCPHQLARPHVFCPMCPLSVHIRVRANYPFGRFLAISPLMQNWWDSQTERKTDLAPARRKLCTNTWFLFPAPAQHKDPVTHPAPTQLEAVTGDWQRGSLPPLSKNPTNSASRGEIGRNPALPTDRPLASGYWLLARDVGYLIRGVSVFRPVGFPSDSQPEAGDAWENFSKHLEQF